MFFRNNTAKPLEKNSSNKFGQIIQEAESRFCNGGKHAERILNALEYNSNGDQIKLMELTSDKLTNIASQVNNSYIHISGNCTLLALCMLYNLKIGEVKLKAGNTFPIHEGIPNSISEFIIFEDPLKYGTKSTNEVANLVENLKELYLETSERFYIIHVMNFDTFFGIAMPGHALNAIVLGNDENLSVVFVDAWKTLNQIQTGQDLQDRYSAALFTIQYHHGPLLEEKNEENKTYKISK